jgi:hypothetical protein
LLQISSSQVLTLYTEGLSMCSINNYYVCVHSFWRSGIRDTQKLLHGQQLLGVWWHCTHPSREKLIGKRI